MTGAVDALCRDALTGWNARVGLIGLGILIALPITLVAIVALTLTLSPPAGVATAIGGMIQLAATFVVAGRLAKREGDA